MVEEYRLFADEFISGSNTYPAIYVSNLGNIKGRSVYLDGRGYLMFRYRMKMIRVHQAVAKLFIENPENKPCIDHINAIRTDNRAENLRWVTYQENNTTELVIERQKETHKGVNQGKNNPRARRVYDDINEKEYGCLLDYSNSIKRNPITVGNWLRGKHSFPKNIKAHYMEEE